MNLRFLVFVFIVLLIVCGDVFMEVSMVFY